LTVAAIDFPPASRCEMSIQSVTELV